MKPVCKYVHIEGVDYQVGMSANVIAVGHPKLRKEPHWVITSEVVSYDKETGNFETLNTIYEKVKDETIPT